MKLKKSSFHLKNTWTGRHLTNGVFTLPKAKVQSNFYDSKPRELPYFFNTTMSEAKETITIEDESEDDDT